MNNIFFIHALLAAKFAWAEFWDWENKEEEVRYCFSIKGTGFRIKPIDILCKHLNASDDNDIDSLEPYLILNVDISY